MFVRCGLKPGSATSREQRILHEYTMGMVGVTAPHATASRTEGVVFSIAPSTSSHETADE